MIRGMFSGLIWGGLASTALGLFLTQYGGRIDVVRAAIPPVALDAATGEAPVEGTANAVGDGITAAPAVGDAPQPGAEPAAEAPVAGGEDVARPTEAAIDTDMASMDPGAETGAGPAAETPSVTPPRAQVTLPQTGADGVPARIPDAPVAVAADDVPVSPDAPAVLTAPDVAQDTGIAGDDALIAPTAPTALTDPAAEDAVAGAAPPEAPASIAEPGDPAAPDVGADEVTLDSTTDTRPATQAPAAPDGGGDATGLGDDVLAALAPELAPPPTPDVDADDAPQFAALPDEATDDGAQELAEPMEDDADAPLDIDLSEEPEESGAQSAARVVVNRLPRIGDPEPGSEEADLAEAADGVQGDAEEATEDVAVAAALADDAPGLADDQQADEDGTAEGDPNALPPVGALNVFAVPYTPQEDLPIMSVVLIDDPNASTNFSALPISVTIAILSDAPGAKDRAASHRAAGREVVLIPPVTSASSRVDIARAMADALDIVPEAVAVMDMPDQRFQKSRFATGEVIVASAATGHGMIVYPGGLNTAERLADQQGVITGRVFRDIDGSGQDLAAVKRFLDQAAFQARQQNVVILIGRNRPDTVQAMAEWVVGRRAESVSLAPVSAALKAGGEVAQ